MSYTPYYNEYTDNPLPDSTERIKVRSVRFAHSVEQLLVIVGAAKAARQARRASAPPSYSNTTSIAMFPMVEVLLDCVHSSGLHASLGCGDYSCGHFLRGHYQAQRNCLARVCCRAIHRTIYVTIRRFYGSLEQRDSLPSACLPEYGVDFSFVIKHPFMCFSNICPHLGYLIVLSLTVEKNCARPLPASLQRN